MAVEPLAVPTWQLTRRPGATWDILATLGSETGFPEQDFIYLLATSQNVPEEEEEEEEGAGRRRRRRRRDEEWSCTRGLDGSRE
eukprot:2684549-Pyramimonas_sp.AAC.1